MKDFSKNKIKLIIAEDNALVRTALIQMLSETSDLTVIAEVTNGNDLLDKILEIEVDVVLTDINMPGKNGWDVLAQLKTEFPGLPVIILSNFSEKYYAVKLYKAGASAYLHKASAPAQLVEAVRKVARGGKYITPEIAEKLVLDADSSIVKQPHGSLSYREFQMLYFFVSGKTVMEIADELSLSIPTINTCKTRILKKMALRIHARSPFTP